MRFADKTVLVTGAARGLGAAMAAGFAREGGNVALIDLPGSLGGEVAQQINTSGVAGSAFFVPCDLADLDRTAQIVRGLAGAHGGVDVLVNNAAIFPRKEVANYTIQEWQDVQQVNVAAAFVCVQAVLPEMRAATSPRKAPWSA
jgi:NAD(P)-dependent dehydrogenase (short-subunit alcohol dehydrogenase family)